MVRQLNERGTITIPKDNLRHLGLKPGDLIDIDDDGTSIVLTPKVAEDKFTDAEWAKLERLSKEKGRSYATAKGAKEHLKRLMK